MGSVRTCLERQHPVGGYVNSACKRVSPFAPQRGSSILSEWVDLAIDPGKHTGWACFRIAGSELTACGSGEPPFDNARRMIVELPQTYPQHPVPPQDLITLAFLAGRYAGAAGNVEVYTVFPHTWKGTLPKKVCEMRVRGHLTPVEQALALNCGVPAGEMNNVWDAIGIGLFAFRKIKL